MKMKRMTMHFALVMLLIVLAVMPLASARKGVGIVWDTQTEIVQENSVHCVQYGIYNPWDEDAAVELSVSDELKDIVTAQESEVKVIPANTSPKQPVPVELCFKIKDVYPKDCVMGLFCKQECSDEEKIYRGKVQATQVAEKGPVSGSKASIGVSVPLTLKVKCSPTKRSFAPLYVALIIIAVGAIAFVFLNNKYPVKRRKKKVKVKKRKR